MLRLPDTNTAFGKLPLRLALVLGVFYFAWWSANVAKPVRNDDALWTYSAKAILQTGVPVIDHGPQPQRHIAVWHPPAFQYLNAALFAMLGASPFVARLCGLLGLIAAFSLLALALRGAGERERLPLALFFFLLAPGLFQGSLIPDIDGTMLLPGAMGLAAAQVRGLRDPDRFPLWTASAFLALMLVSKWTSPPLLWLTWALWLWKRRGLRQAWLQAGRTLILGGLMGAGLYLSWAAAAGISPFYPFEFSFLAKAGAAQVTWMHRLQSLKNGLGVVGPGLLILGVVLFAYAKRRPNGEAARLLLAQALVLALAYSLLFPGLGYHVLTWKYLMPAWGLAALALTLAWPAKGDWEEPTPSMVKGLCVGAVLGVVVLLQRKIYQPWPWSLLTLALCWMGYRYLSRRFYRGIAAIALVAMVMGSAQAARYSFLMTQVDFDNSPAFPTPEKGFYQASLWLEKSLASDDVVMARKDLTVLLPFRQGVPIDPHFTMPKRGMTVPLEARPRAEAFQKHWPFEVADSNFYTMFELADPSDPANMESWLRGPVTVVVDSTMDSYLKNPQVRAMVEADYQLIETFDHYQVWRRKRG